MTYGENGNQIRLELTTLLQQHRIQQWLGGRGSYTIPETTTVEQRRQMGERIQRYRWATLMWCLQAVAAANPKINLESSGERSRGPAEALRYHLTKSLKAMEIGLPLFEELTTPQAFPVVESWRQVAKSAVLGEHDFSAGVGYGRLSEQECMTVLKDAAEITRAVLSSTGGTTTSPAGRRSASAAA